MIAVKVLSYAPIAGGLMHLLPTFPELDCTVDPDGVSVVAGVAPPSVMLSFALEFLGLGG